MKIEKIRIQNFRSLHNIELDNIPSLAVFVGESGKSRNKKSKIASFVCLISSLKKSKITKK